MKKIANKVLKSTYKELFKPKSKDVEDVFCQIIAEIGHALSDK